MKVFPSHSLQRVGMVCSQLLYADDRYVSLLPSQEDLLSMLTYFDKYVSAWSSIKDARKMLVCGVGIAFGEPSSVLDLMFEFHPGQPDFHIMVSLYW